jgi:hypothetical protein
VTLLLASYARLIDMNRVLEQSNTKICCEFDQRHLVVYYRHLTMINEFQSAYTAAHDSSLLQPCPCVASRLISLHFLVAASGIQQVRPLGPPEKPHCPPNFTLQHSVCVLKASGSPMAANTYNDACMHGPQSFHYVLFIEVPDVGGVPMPSILPSIFTDQAAAHQH